MTKPLISIIVTNYNYAKYLEECILSCLNQECDITYEVILVDDGSTDNSLKILNSIKDTRLEVIKRKNGGIEAASNDGINYSKGEYIVRVDADDYLLPNYLRNIVDSITKSTCQFAYSNYQVVDEFGKIQSYEKLPPFNRGEIFQRGDFLATGTVYKRSVIVKFGSYNEKFPNCGLENYELIVNLIMNNCVGLHINKNLFSYRLHGKNISSKRRSSIIKYGNKLFKAFSLGSYTTNQFHPYKLKLD